jgi:hypothetical protein
MGTAIFIGVVVGITWFLSKVISFFGLPASASAIIIGSFAGMGYSISYKVYEGAFRDNWELKREMKDLERQMKRDMQEAQRQQQVTMLRQRMQTQMNQQNLPQTTQLGATFLPSETQPASQPPAGPNGNAPTFPIQGEDYTISTHM